MTGPCMRGSSVLVATAVLVAGAVAGVAAQERRDSVAHRGGMGMMRMMAMMDEYPMMRSARQGPGAALEHREALGLADAQVEGLERLESEASKAHDEAMDRMREFHREIRAATEADRFDEAATRAAWERMGKVHADWGVTLSRGARATRDVLPPEQRGTLASLSSGMKGDHAMMMRMMDHMRTMQCPMMRDDSAGAHQMQRP